MTRADEIRRHVIDRYIEPARRDGKREVIVRAGDVHNEMGLKNAMPSVCGAVGSQKFESLARVQRISLVGPAQGSNAEFTFGL